VETAETWLLDTETLYLNHGSFGSCPLPVLREQQRLQAELERRPMAFLDRELEGRLDAARAALCGLVGARPEDLVFVRNATTGVNTVLAGVDLEPTDELLITTHAYEACRNAALRIATLGRGRVVPVRLPFPLSGPEQVVAAVLAAVTPRTRWALLDHVTSPTGLVLPIDRLVAELRERGVETLVDGAHAPGMVPLNLDGLGAACYTGNCHKWLCTPKGSAFLHLRRDLHERIRPLVTSLGYGREGGGRSRLHREFDWCGTDDPTPILCLPVALRFLEGLDPDGLPGLMAANRRLALEARDLLCRRLGTAPPCPDSMIGSLAAVVLPPLRGDLPASAWPRLEPLQAWLLQHRRLEVPVICLRGESVRLVRVSAQAYNRLEDYERLADALGEVCAPPAGSGALGSG
jgi:isopenicillin-N epimerase